MVRIAAFATLFLVGCPKPKPDGGPTVPEGAGCPAAQDVYVASYLVPDEGAPAGNGKGGHTGWVLPLHDKPVDTVEGVPEYVAIDSAAATAAGVPPAPANLWLLGPGGAPCRASVGRYYAAAIAAQAPNITYGVELGGCPAPKDPETASAIIVVSPESPGGCSAVGPRPVAQRLGEVDKAGSYARPTKETPIPPALASQVPPRECAAPACEKLWSVAQVDVAGKPVAWAGAVNWVEIPEGSTNHCEWKTDAWSGFFIAPESESKAGIPTKVTEGQDHPLALTAVLVDKRGANVLVAEGPGEYATYDLAPGTATLGRHLVWLRPDPESYAVVDHLLPECDQ